MKKMKKVKGRETNRKKTKRYRKKNERKTPEMEMKNWIGRKNEEIN